MAAERFDLMLLGYRNDLARERTLEYLRAQPAASYGPAPIERHAPLPRRLYHGINYDHGFRLLVPLRERGAQVQLVPSAAAVSKPEAVREQATPPSHERASRSTSFLRGFALYLLLGVLAAAASHVVATRPPAPAKPPLGLAAPILAPPAPLANMGPNRLNAEALQLNGEGDFAAAAKRLRAALAQQPDQPVLRGNLRTVLRNWAVAEVNTGRYGAAIERAEEALELGEDAGVLAVVGIAQARLGEWDKARDVLERAVSLGATDPAALFALGTAYRQIGRLEPAVEMLQRAREAGAQGPDFDATLAKLQRELDAEWGFSELTSPHFQIGFEEGENHRAARLVLSGLEEAYFFVGHKLSYHPSQITPVVLYPEQEFHDVTQVPSWTGGVFDGRIKLPVRGLEDDSPILDRTLRHEFAHVLVSLLSRNRAPVWLSEGVAIWSEEESEGEREDWARRAIAGRRLLTLDSLDSSFTGLPESQVPVAYAQSYLAVRAILDESGAVHLRQLLESLGQGHSIDEAFESVLSTHIADFEAGLVQDLTG